MERKKKKGIILIGYGIAAVVAIAGEAVHPAAAIAGIIGMACIAGYCAMDL
jgi:hypothetical protein